ncbi:hypothetical protein BDZ89DRAFT_1054060 [Hymenopellis radicata]|nr:hypothetical protein BDZ89DRAFT_1054060 [Hymenopellis radicata]
MSSNPNEDTILGELLKKIKTNTTITPKILSTLVETLKTVDCARIEANRARDDAETHLLNAAADVQKVVNTVQAVVGDPATEILKDLLTLMEISSKKGQEDRVLREASRAKANVERCLKLYNQGVDDDAVLKSIRGQFIPCQVTAMHVQRPEKLTEAQLKIVAGQMGLDLDEPSDFEEKRLQLLSAIGKTSREVEKIPVFD